MTDVEITDIFLMFSILVLIYVAGVIIFVVLVQNIKHKMHINKIESSKKQIEIERLVKIYFAKILEILKK